MTTKEFPCTCYPMAVDRGILCVGCQANAAIEEAVKTERKRLYTLEQAYEDWVAAKVVIERLLADLFPMMTTASLDHNSSALLARRVTTDPPLHVVRESTVNWGEG